MTCTKIKVALLMLLLAFTVSSREQSYYDILGISRRASIKQIKSAFRRLSMKYHPDRNGSPEAKEKYQHILEAYGVLSDQEQRAAYDRGGKEAVNNMNQRNQQGGGFQNIQDILNSFFGGDPFQQQGQGHGHHHHYHHGYGHHQRRVQPLELKLRVTLKDIYMGRSFEFIVSKKMLPDYCKDQDLGYGGRQCDRVIKGFEKNTLYIEKGTKDGDVLLVEKGYDERTDGLVHDIAFRVTVLRDPRFTVEGNNLRTNMEITLQEALSGFTKEFKHIDGSILKISNRTPVTNPNQIIMVRNKGLFFEKYSERQGNLLIKIKITLPTSLTPEKLALWKEFFDAQQGEWEGGQAVIN